MITRRGNEFEEGTITYIIGPTNDIFKFSTVRHPARPSSYPFVSSVLFYFDPQDELWAEQSVREIWHMFPTEHPHITLFEILMYSLYDL